MTSSDWMKQQYGENYVFLFEIIMFQVSNFTDKVNYNAFVSRQLCVYG